MIRYLDDRSYSSSRRSIYILSAFAAAIFFYQDDVGLFGMLLVQENPVQIRLPHFSIAVSLLLLFFSARLAIAIRPLMAQFEADWDLKEYEHILGDEVTRERVLEEITKLKDDIPRLTSMMAEIAPVYSQIKTKIEEIAEQEFHLEPNGPMWDEPYSRETPANLFAFVGEQTKSNEEMLRALHYKFSHINMSPFLDKLLSERTTMHKAKKVKRREVIVFEIFVPLSLGVASIFILAVHFFKG